MSEEVDDFLAHYGVKGMKWGKRKSDPEKDRLKQLGKAKRELNNLDANNALAGYGLKGYHAKKLYDKELKKNPEFSVSKLSPEERAARDRKVTQRAIRGSVTRGAIEVPVVLAGGAFLVSRVNGSAQTKNGGYIGVAMLAGQAGKMRVDEIRAVQTANKLDRLRDEVKTLERPKR